MGVRLATAEETRRYGRRLAAAAGPGDVIALVGALGAGKTELVKGVTEELGCEVEATSPTFTLVHEYRGGRLLVFHFDFYRLEVADEVLGIGWDEFLDGGGLCIIEWADRFPHLLPERTLWRRIAIEGDGSRSVVGHR